MRISAKPFTEYITPTLENLGRKVTNSPKYKKVNDFLTMDGMNFKIGAFMGLMLGGVLVPRMYQAQKRDNGTGDEMREIFTRDVVTIFTLVFAMKGLHSLIAGQFCKKNGLVLLSKPEAEIKGFFKKIAEYIKPSGGLDSLTNRQYTPKYSGFGLVAENKVDQKLAREQFGDFLKWLQESGGDVKKVLTFDKNKNGKLTEATRKLFGTDDLKAMKAEDIIAKCTQGSNADEYISILNKKEKNPLLAYATKINTWFATASLAAITVFVGSLLPKINEMMTNRKYLNQGGGIRPEYENPYSLCAKPKIPALAHKMPEKQFSAFQAFV